MNSLTSLFGKGMIISPIIIVTTHLGDSTSSMLEENMNNPVPQNAYVKSFNIQSAFDESFDVKNISMPFDKFKAVEVMTKFVDELVKNIRLPDREAAEILEEHLWDLV